MTESGAQLFARLDARRCLKDVEPRLFPERGGPEHGDVVELHGPAGTGKTELLYHLLCRCVMPAAAGGLEVEVMFVDTDYSLDMLRLVSILDRRLSAGTRARTLKQTEPCLIKKLHGRSDLGQTLEEQIRFPAEVHLSWSCWSRSMNHWVHLSIFASVLPAGTSGSASAEATLRSCLSRLLVVHCCSSSQLLLTLHFLETSLSSRPSLALLLIDSISAFYWLDRSEGGASMAKQEEKLSKCSGLLARLLRDYRITVFATCHAIRRNCAGPSASSQFARPYLCRPWQRLVKHRLLCSREQTVTCDPVKGEEEERRHQVFGVQSTSSSFSSERSSSFYVTDAGVQFV